MKIQEKQDHRPLPALAKGFSLFEMVIVMGIIGLILGGAIYTMGNIRGSAAIGTADQDMKAFEAALDQYKNIGRMYPTTEQGLEALYERPTSAPKPRRWIQTINKEDALLDPWDTKYKYELGEDNKPIITSAGPDRKFNTDDDLSNRD